jgi:hypothetical protein
VDYAKALVDKLGVRLQVQLFFWHFGVPALSAVVCALSLIGGAYLAHSVHAGIESLPRGSGTPPARWTWWRHCWRSCGRPAAGLPDWRTAGSFGGTCAPRAAPNS